MVSARFIDQRRAPKADGQWGHLESEGNRVDQDKTAILDLRPAVPVIDDATIAGVRGERLRVAGLAAALRAMDDDDARQ